jgi:hypothetical protein
LERVGILLVAFDELRLASSIDYLNRFPADERLIILNKASLQASTVLQNTAKRWQIILGSNSSGEFSGWQEGLDHLDRQGRFDRYIFANDTVVSHRKYTWVRHLAFQHELSRRSSCFGFTNSVKSTFYIENMPLKRWISTYLFCFNNSTLDQINRQLDYSELVEKYVNKTVDERNFLSEKLCPALRDHLNNWLFKGGWYTSQPLSEFNYEFLRRKAVSILNEKYLSALLKARGVVIRDPLITTKGLARLDRFLSSKNIAVL